MLSVILLERTSFASYTSDNCYLDGKWEEIPGIQTYAAIKTHSNRVWKGYNLSGVFIAGRCKENESATPKFYEYKSIYLIIEVQRQYANVYDGLNGPFFVRV